MGDKRSKSYNTIKQIFEARRSRLLARGFSEADSLIERLEILILETKAGHDGLYHEMFKISTQLLSMNIFNQEQLDHFFKLW